jgi:hypothetical protein
MEPGSAAATNSGPISGNGFQSISDAAVAVAVNELWNTLRENNGKPREKAFKPDPEFAVGMRAAINAALKVDGR